MATDNSEDYPDHYIFPPDDDEKFVYKMYRISGELNWRHVQSIHLRCEKLMIHGTLIKESNLDRIIEVLFLGDELAVFLSIAMELAISG